MSQTLIVHVLFGYFSQPDKGFGIDDSVLAHHDCRCHITYVNNNRNAILYPSDSLVILVNEVPLVEVMALKGLPPPDSSFRKDLNAALKLIPENLQPPGEPTWLILSTIS